MKKAMAIQNAYIEGFCKAAEAYGADHMGLLEKTAAPLPKPVLELIAAKGGQIGSKLTPEQLSMLSSVYASAVGSRSKNLMAAREAAYRYFKNNWQPVSRGSLTPEAALRQMRVLTGGEALPEVLKFRKQESLLNALKSVLDTGVKGGHSGYYLNSVGRKSNPKYVARKLKGTLQRGRREFFSLAPSKRRKALSNYGRWMEPMTPYSSADEVAEFIRNNGFQSY